MSDSLVPRDDDATASDLVRFSGVDTDTVVAELITRYHRSDEDVREQIRQSLDREDHDRLYIYLLRRSLMARRDANRSFARMALDGFHLRDAILENDWRNALKYAMFVARSLNEDFDDVMARCNEYATSASAHEFESALDSLSRVERLDQVGFVEVTTKYGIGLVQLPEPLNPTVTGWLRGAPILKPDAVTYEPTTNLAALAIDLAEEFAQKCSLVSSDFTAESLASAWFDNPDFGPFMPVTGCLAFSLFDAESDVALYEVFVAELDDEDVDVLEPDDDLTDDDVDDDVDDDTDDDTDDDVDASADIVVLLGRVAIVLAAMPKFDADDETSDEDSEDRVERLRRAVDDVLGRFSPDAGAH